MAGNNQALPSPSYQLVDQSGKISPVWFQFMNSLWQRTGGGSNTGNVQSVTATGSNGVDVVVTNGSSNPNIAISLDLANVVEQLSLFTPISAGIVPASGGGATNFLRADGTWDAPAGSGSVSSVGYQGDGVIFNTAVPGSPITSSGTFVPALLTQTSNTVLAGPITGSAATPTFRALAGPDLPNPSATTLGGVESYASVSHQWINTISTAGVPSSTQPAFSDISGQATLAQLPTIATDTVLANVTSGSAVPTAATPSAIIDTIGATQGDILYRDSSVWKVLAPGTSGQVLQSGGASANPSWLTISGGSVPYFEVYRSTNQTFIASTPTKIAFDTVISDPFSYWDATNHRWTPTPAGTYLFTLQVYFNGTSSVGNFIEALIEKNGGPVNFQVIFPPALTSTGLGSCTVVSIMAMNGSTDYIEGWVNANVTSPIVNGGSAPYLTYMAGNRIGA
jgi:hypothetical protein